MIPRVAKIPISEAKAIFRHRLAEGASLLAISQHVGAALNMVTNILIARLLGPTDYGLVALAVAYPTMLYSFVSIKSVSVTTRYVAAFRAKKETEKLEAIVKLGYGLDFYVSLMALTLVAISSWWVSERFYRQPYLAWLMVVYAGSFPLFSLTGNSWAVLSSWGRFRLLAIFEVLHPFLKLCLTVGFIVAGFGVSGVVIGMGLAQASIGLIMMIATTDLLLCEGLGTWWKASLKPVVSLKRELMGFFGWNYLSVTLSSLMGQLPVMLLGRFRGPEEAGFYRIATSIVTVSSYLQNALGRVAYPILSARWSIEERENLRNSLKRWTLYAGLPAGMSLILMIPLLPFLVILLFGSNYQPIITGAQVMMLSAAISTIFFWLSPFYYASGRISLWVKGYTLQAGLLTGLGWFIIQHWGFMGLAWLTASGQVLFTVLMLALCPHIKMDKQNRSSQ
jgi:O-antigen/teichoic acid export membrane protein